ncbi:hypothetical protein DPEC_G00105670 [Dallia pectoralis]|uniref:Uncharacterized protein n=1 Tax=Dallia pectoralis TaxID=75939 RepID=A0ACC2GXT5_DALPE|nr:hypothetical protein DPEC_G00105670 [Dallia pectoralis]
MCHAPSSPFSARGESERMQPGIHGNPHLSRVNLDTKPDVHDSQDMLHPMITGTQGVNRPTDSGQGFNIKLITSVATFIPVQPDL